MTISANFEGVRHAVDSRSADGARRCGSARNFRRDENMNFIDGAACRTVNPAVAAALNEHIGHLPAAEFVKQRADVVRRASRHRNAELQRQAAVSRLQASAGASPPTATINGTSARGLDKPTINRKRRRRIDHHARGSAFQICEIHRPGCQQRVVGPRRATPHDRSRRLARESGVPQPATLRWKSTCCRRARVASLPSSVIAHFAMIHGRPVVESVLIRRKKPIRLPPVPGLHRTECPPLRVRQCRGRKLRGKGLGRQSRHV